MITTTSFQKSAFEGNHDGISSRTIQCKEESDNSESFDFLSTVKVEEESSVLVGPLESQFGLRLRDNCLNGECLDNTSSNISSGNTWDDATLHWFTGKASVCSSQDTALIISGDPQALIISGDPQKSISDNSIEPVENTLLSGGNNRKESVIAVRSSENRAKITVRSVAKINSNFVNIKRKRLAAEEKIQDVNIEECKARVDALIPKAYQFPTGNYKCHCCNTDFITLIDWQDHILLYIQYLGCFPRKCKDFVAEDDRLIFMDNLYQCGYCSFTARRTLDIYWHVNDIHKNIRSKCAICPSEFGKILYLKKHLDLKHNPTKSLFACRFCNYKTNNRTTMKGHERAVHKVDGYVACEICSKTFSDPRMLKRHLNKDHTLKTIKRYKCPKCSYTSTQNTRIRRHFLRVHDKQVEYSCFYCGYKTTFKDYLKNHIYINHIKNKKMGKFKCDLCSKKFTSLSGLSIHNIHLHRYDREVKCPKCSDMFQIKLNLIIHDNIVHNSKPEFQCNECNFVGQDKSKLMSHINVHKRVYNCNFCTYTTKGRSQIVSHLIKHNPYADMFKCRKCKYRTKKKELLKQHINVKHNPNPIIYMCHHCGHQNKIKHKLSQHMQTKHADILKGNRTNKIKRKQIN